jgi:hypothetical protein
MFSVLSSWLKRWNETQTLSTAYFNSIVNVVSRVHVIRVQSQTSGGFGVLERFPEIKTLMLNQHLERIEKMMRDMKKYM